jgi:hypothetical protein
MTRLAAITPGSAVQPTPLQNSALVRSTREAHMAALVQQPLVVAVR